MTVCCRIKFRGRSPRNGPLKAGQLRGNYILEKQFIDDRSVVRIRRTIQKQLVGYKSRVKHMLHCHGVELPERFSKVQTHWSRAFLKKSKMEDNKISIYQTEERKVFANCEYKST